MNSETFRLIADFLSLIPSRVTFCGMGAPTRHPDWPEFLKIYREKGGTAGIVENALNLTAETFAQIKTTPPSFMEVSLPTLEPELFKRLTGGQVEQALYNLNLLFEVSEKRFPVIVIGINTTLNPLESESFIDFFQKRGLRARVADCHSRGGNLESSLVTAKVESISQCGLLKFHSFFTWQGDLLACCHDLNLQTRLGNIHSDTFNQLLQKRATLAIAGHDFQICKSCDEPMRNKAFPQRPFPETSRAKARFLANLSKSTK